MKRRYPDNHHFTCNKGHEHGTHEAAAACDNVRRIDQQATAEQVSNAYKVMSRIIVEKEQERAKLRQHSGSAKPALTIKRSKRIAALTEEIVTLDEARSYFK